jgi:hypothetical protein
MLPLFLHIVILYFTANFQRVVEDFTILRRDAMNFASFVTLTWLTVTEK